jgi:hypothetical protein
MFRIDNWFCPSVDYWRGKHATVDDDDDDDDDDTDAVECRWVMECDC